MHTDAEPLRSRSVEEAPSHPFRVVPGGYNVNRLPISVPRASGESLESWLHRTAYRYGVHPRFMLGALGFDVRPQTRVDPLELFSGPQEEAAAGLLGLDVETLTARPRLAGALATARERHRREFRKLKQVLNMRGSRWCPLCLTETGAWQESWKDPLHIYCAEHARTLVAHCPKCDQVPYANTAWLTSAADPVTCPTFVSRAAEDGGRYRDRCGARLDEAYAPSARDLAVEDQDQILNLAYLAAEQPEALVKACGVQARAQPVYEAVLEMIEQAVGALDLLVPADQTPYIARALRGAAEVLNAHTPEFAFQTANHYGLLWRDSALVVLGPRSAARLYPRNPLITAMWLSDLRGRFAIGHELRFRMGSDRPRYPDGWQDHDRVLHPDDSYAGVPPSWIPQTAWTGALRFEHSRALGLETAPGRALVSLCLAQYGTTRTWREVATCLGLPAWTATPIMHVLRDIEDSGRLPAFLRAIDELFRRIHEAPPPIDYDARRAAVWSEAALSGTTSNVRAEMPAHMTRIETSRALWALYTGSVSGFAPPGYVPPPPPWPAQRRRAEPEALRLVVDIEHFPDSLVDGPLTWTPP